MAAKPFAVNHDLASADVNDLLGVNVRAPTEVDVASSVTETALISQSIAANAMSTDRTLHCVLGGDILQNATALATIRVKLGATTLWENTNMSVGSNDVDRRAWLLEIWLQNINSASVQRMVGRFDLGDATAATQGISTQYAQTLPFAGTSAIATSSAATFAVTVQWNTNSANASFRKRLGALNLW